MENAKQNKMMVLLDKDNRIKNKFSDNVKGIYDYVVFLEEGTREHEGYTTFEVEDFKAFEGLYIPKLENGAWVEGATQEEIDNITFVILTSTSEQQLVTEMTIAMAQIQMDNMMAIAELTNLIMAMGGVNNV